jgi:DNA-binding response OmpR family regulator
MLQRYELFVIQKPLADPRLVQYFRPLGKLPSNRAERRHNWIMRVLIVEDDVSVAAGIVDGLSNTSFETRHVSTGGECLSAMASFQPDLVLLDLGLPDMDGTDVCRAIRATSLTPIIVVSARDDEVDRVVALEMGADDYVVKPFGMRELVARIRAVSRRTASTDAEPIPPERHLGALVIDTRSQRVTLDGKGIYLTPKEFDLLVYLSQDPGAVFRRSAILHDIWGTNWYGTTKTLDAHIAAIRKKLGRPEWIESVRGVGFRFGIPT